MLILLVDTGLYLTVLLRGMQFRALPDALRLIKEETAIYFKLVKHYPNNSLNGF